VHEVEPALISITPILNHVLAQSPWAKNLLKPHAGKFIQVDAPPFMLALQVMPEGGLGVAPAGTAADITFRIKAAQLPLLLADPATALKAVRIEGDAEFAQVINRLVREVRWDAEEDLSRLVGDVPAYHAMRLARSFVAWGRDASGRLSESAAAYLADETPTLLRGRAAEEFALSVAEARDACARLEKRIALMEARRAGAPG
jgi:ubiquinone biosynthesis protein UbiJ